MKFTTLMMPPEDRFYHAAFGVAVLIVDVLKGAGKPTPTVFDLGCKIVRAELNKAERQMRRIMEQQE